MRFLAVDDESIMLNELVNVLKRVCPDAETEAFTRPEDGLDAAAKSNFDVAFLDIQMGRITGLELAARIKKLNADTHIIFVTGYSEYALEAFRVRATGYLLKPVQENDIRRELTFIYEGKNKERIEIQTFGGFEVYVDGEAVKFGRAKSKELLAYLVDHRGAAVTSAEAFAALFEDTAATENTKSYFRIIVRELKNSLKRVNAEEILVKGYNSYAVAPDKFTCDYYRFLEGDPVAVNHYRNDYMPSYSWAEVHNAGIGMGTWENGKIGK